MFNVYLGVLQEKTNSSKYMFSLQATTAGTVRRDFVPLHEGSPVAFEHLKPPSL